MRETLIELRNKASEAFDAWLMMDEKTPDKIREVVNTHLNERLWAVEHRLKEKD